MKKQKYILDLCYIVLCLCHHDTCLQCFLLRNFKLLSFGEEAEEDEEETSEANRKYSGRSKSTHDILKDPGLSAVPAIETEEEIKEINKWTLGSSDSDPALSEDEVIHRGSNASHGDR